MKTYVLAAALLAASFTATAGNYSCNNRCGEEGGTINAPVANGGSGYGGDSTAVGVGVGVGLGGSGGQGGAGGRGGDGGNALALGGSGGTVSDSGNSHNLNSNKNDATAISGSKSDSASLSNAVSKSGATSSSGGNSLTSGPTTVGGQNSANANNTSVTMKTERNAPPVFLGAITPTSCGGSFNAGGSSRDGAGGLGFSWVGKECRIRQVGDRYHALGMVDTACEIYKTTKGFRDAAKANPKLRDLDCTVKPATVPAPVIPQAFLEAHTPRG